MTSRLILSIVLMLGVWNRYCPGLDGQIAPAFSGQAAPPAEIRVYLMETGLLKVSCRGGHFQVRNPGVPGQAISVPEGTVGQIRQTNQRWNIAEAGGRNLGELSGTTIEIISEGNSPLAIQNDAPAAYRGFLRCTAKGENRLAVINAVGMEEYLSGVVGAEMYSHWETEALRAQSIASRTYAMYQVAIRRQAEWDVGDTQMSQVYAGVSREHPQVSEAVQATRGIVMAYGEPGREKIFPAYFCSNCGGHTQNAAVVFGQKIGPLRGKPCPYCQSVAADKFFTWPSVKVSKTRVSDLLTACYPLLKEKIGRVADIAVRTKSESGRIEKIELVGETGRKAAMRGEDFRLAVSSTEAPIRSIWCDIVDGGDSWIFSNGRGWGHGVGMCQCGVQQMARLGKNCIEILDYYYPGASLVKAY